MARRRAVLFAGAVALAALVVAVAVRPGGDDDLRAGSELVAEAGGPLLAVTRTPASYRIVYRVESGPVDRRVVSTDVLEVRRPFDSRLETRDGDTVDGAPASLQVTAFGRMLAAGEAGQRVVLSAPPAPAVSDVRVDSVLAGAAEAGVLEPRERRRVAGRECQVYRSADLLTTGDLVGPTPPGDAPDGDAEWADTCIDEAGLLLEELLFAGDSVLLRRVALEVAEDVALDDGRFETGEPTVPVGEGGGSVQRLSDDSRTPGTFWELDGPTPGWEHRGRYAVVPPQAEAFTDPLRHGDRVASVMDVQVRGADVLVVEQGAVFGGGRPFSDERAVRATSAGELGDVHVVLSGLGPLVRADLGGGNFVRLFGTVPTTDLLAVAARLRAVEGGELTVLDGAASG